MAHEIHTSERRSFRSCKRRWDWAYRDGYVPHETPKPLEFGIAFHEALEVFFTPATWGTTTPEEKLAAATVKFTEVCEEQRQNFLTVTNQRALDIAQGDDYKERIDLGIGMLTHYKTHIHPSDTWFKPVATEIAFEVPLLDDNGDNICCVQSPMCGQTHPNEGEGSHVVYSGRIDMLVEDLRFGGYYIWDHKSARDLAPDNSFLDLDDQVASYCWALQVKLGLDVKGFVYAEYRKDYPRVPEKLSRKYKGCMFSTAKTQATSAEIFVPYVKEHDTQAYNDGCYTEYIGWLNTKDGPKYHQRFPIPKTDKELANIGENLTKEALDMTDPDLRIYPNVARMGCGYCSYKEPCLGKQRGEDYVYTLNSLFHKVEYRYYNKPKAE